MKIKISAKSAKQVFNKCTCQHITEVCKGVCCRSSSQKTGILITIHPNEQSEIKKLGGIVKDGLLQPKLGERKCPFQETNYLCKLHNTPYKPFGCIASPFTLNKNGTLIIRNRYRLFKGCYKYGEKIPAYKAFRTSLNIIFGFVKAQQICDHLDNNGNDIIVEAPQESYLKLIENDRIKHNTLKEK